MRAFSNRFGREINQCPTASRQLISGDKHTVEHPRNHALDLVFLFISLLADRSNCVIVVRQKRMARLRNTSLCAAERFCKVRFRNNVKWYDVDNCLELSYLENLGGYSCDVGLSMAAHSEQLVRVLVYAE